MGTQCVIGGIVAAGIVIDLVSLLSDEGKANDTEHYFGPSVDAVFGIRY